MALRAIAYASQVVEAMPLEQVQNLTADAERFNVLAGVTGVLLFDGQTFMQYIEGPEDGISLIYSRITHSRRHCEIVELGRATISGRRFPYWSMRLLRAEDAQVRAVARADWSRFRLQPASTGKASGIELLSSVVAPYIAAA